VFSKNNDFTKEKPGVKRSPETNFIFFKADKKVYKYYFVDILFIEGSGNYVKIHLLNEKPLMVPYKLKEHMDKLLQKKFLRI